MYKYGVKSGIHSYINLQRGTGRHGKIESLELGRGKAHVADVMVPLGIVQHIQRHIYVLQTVHYK